MNYFKMKLKHLLLIIFVGIIVIYFYGQKSANKTRCFKYLLFNNTDYSGVIIEKLVDTLNHNIETLTIKNNSNTIEWMTNFDISGFFKYVEEFDSLLKKPNEIYVKIFRNNKLDTTFLLIMAAKKTIINKS